MCIIYDPDVCIGGCFFDDSSEADALVYFCVIDPIELIPFV